MDTVSAPPPRPIFIIGAPRSGTSILTWCLAQHSNILLVPETNWIAALASQLDHFWSLGSSSGFYTQLSNFGTDNATFAAAFGRMVDELVRTGFEAKYRPLREALRAGAPPEPVRAWLRAADDPKCRWVDGTPANTPYAGVFARMWPEARFVHLVRNPDDVVASHLASAQAERFWSERSAAIAYVYHARRSALIAEVALGRERVSRVSYEHFIADPGPVLARLLHFLGEPFEEACLAPLSEVINNSDPDRKRVVARDLCAADQRLLRQMHDWHAAGRDPDWRIDMTPEAATAALARYGAIPINAPAPTQSLDG